MAEVFCEYTLKSVAGRKVIFYREQRLTGKTILTLDLTSARRKKKQIQKADPRMLEEHRLHIAI